MKVFYAELAANPAYYAFGYSIYGQLEEGDRIEDAYEQGLMPFIGGRQQPDRMLYMARGSRVRVQEFKELHYHTYARTKFAPYSSGFSVREYLRENYPDREFLASFLYTYFTYRFGKGSVPKDRIDAILSSPLLTHIVEYRLDEGIVGFSLETQVEGLTHLWYYSYVQEHEKHCLGLRICLDIMERAKASGRTFLYFGSTYGNWMRYKTYFQPLEYWDGSTWVSDPKSKKLKKLLAADPLRSVAISDPWRDAHDPYLVPPYPYESVRNGMRFLVHAMYATPKLFGAALLLIALLWGAFLLRLFF
jgi:hypothetical protein